jgi:hypothetical protein
MATYHIHHIVPRHAGGTDDPDNLVKVTVEEHAELHFARYLQYGEMGDWVAANTLSGQMTQAEAIAEARRDWIERHPDHHRKAGQVGGKAPASEKAKQIAKVVAAKTGKKPWWNNGLNNKRSYTCPGEGYVPGKLPHGKHNRTYTQCPHCEMTCCLSNLSRHILSKHF